MNKHFVITTAIVIVIANLDTPVANSAQRDRENIIAQLRQIQSQLQEIQNSNNTLAQVVLELKAQYEGQQNTLQKALADSTLSIEELNHDLSILSARVNETNERVGNLRQEFSSMRQNQQPLILPTPEEDSEQDSSNIIENETADTGPGPPTVLASNVSDIYNQARLDYTQGRYALAVSGFKDVITTDRDGDLADNAHYWIGESYLAQRQYQKSIDSFDTVINDYPDSNKLSDAYLKKGIAFQSTEKFPEAMAVYQLVIDEFPRTPYERIARSRLDELMRTTLPPR